MATISFNGDIGTPSKGFNLKVDVTYSQNIATNKTTITSVQGYVKRNNSTYYPYNSTSSAAFSIKETSGSQLYSITKNPKYDLGSNGYKSVLNISPNAEISHSADGKKTIVITFSFDGKLSSYYPNGSISRTIELPTIPRTSSVTCADGNIGSATTININRASSSFTHTLTYSFQGLTGTIATKTSGTSIGWTIPASFYAKIPNANSGKGTITCSTYSGNTLIGTSTCTFNAFVVNSNPTISGIVEDTNTSAIQATGNKNKLIRYISNAKVVITAIAKNSATISSVKVVNGSQTKTTSTSTINSVDSDTFNLTCTDSRGLTATENITKEFIEYIKPVIVSALLSRPTTTSNTINASVQGLCYNGSFGVKTNSFELKWRYKKSTDTSWGNYITVTATRSGNNFTFSGELGTDFSYTEAFNFEFVLSDYFISNTYSTTVTRGLPIIDIGKDDVNINGSLYENNRRVITTDGGTITGQFSSANNNFIYANNEFNFASESTTNIYINYRAGTGNKTTYPITDYKFSNGQKNGRANIEGKDMCANGGLLKSTNNGNTVSIGSQNSSYCHIYSSANIPFYFNKDLYVNGARVAAVLTAYNNASGTSGTVTLSYSANNYKHIRITYKNDDGQYGSTTFSGAGDANCTIYGTIIRKNISNSLMMINSALFEINGTTITISRNSQADVYFSSSNPASDSNKLYITKVELWN